MTPITKTCTSSQENFIVFDEDQAYYAKRGVPLPKLSPKERLRRRLTWRNERTLYLRKCSATGKNMLSIFHAEQPFPVYDNDYWWSDHWDPLSYGRDFDFNRPFFEQFQALQNQIPHYALAVIKPTMENSDFCNQAGNLKNCYLMFSSSGSEQCLYGTGVQKCFDCVDCLNILECEACYETVQCYRCSFSSYIWYSQNTTHSHFSRNLVGCQYCFGCVNLVNKSYYFFNEACTPEQWHQKVAQWRSTYDDVTTLKHFIQFQLSFPVRYMGEKNTENCTGNILLNCRDCYRCFHCIGTEKSRYCNDLKKGNSLNYNNYDVSYFGRGVESSYECVSVGNNAHQLRFCENTWSNVSHLTYCRLCMSSEHLFGCIGVRNRKFCILNKQYKEDEYHKLVARIIEHMKFTGEWGEFFPIELNPYTYNETLAQDFMPLTQEKALQAGHRWRELPQTRHTNEDPNVRICEVSGRPFKLTPQEKSFYQKMNLAEPKRHPEQRHQDRLYFRNPYELWTRPCAKTGRKLESSYAPHRPEIIYSQEAYLEELYGKPLH